MSRIGRSPIPVPKGVEIKINKSHVTAKGPNGTLEREFHPDMTIALTDGILLVTRPSDEKNHRSLHGLSRALLNNMVKGVTEGFKKQLLIVGVGFKAEKKNKGVLMNIGFSHPVFVSMPAGVKLEVPNATTIIVSGPDAEMVGQVAAEIRACRKPEPYKGKGIKYSDEVVVRKAGKTGKTGK